MNRRFRNRSARHFGTGQGISPAMRRPVKRAFRDRAEQDMARENLSDSQINEVVNQFFRNSFNGDMREFAKWVDEVGESVAPDLAYIELDYISSTRFENENPDDTERALEKVFERFYNEKPRFAKRASRTANTQAWNILRYFGKPTVRAWAKGDPNGYAVASQLEDIDFDGSVAKALREAIGYQAKSRFSANRNNVMNHTHRRANRRVAGTTKQDLAGITVTNKDMGGGWEFYVARHDQGGYAWYLFNPSGELDTIRLTNSIDRALGIAEIIVEEKLKSQNVTNEERDQMMRDNEDYLRGLKGGSRRANRKRASKELALVVFDQIGGDLWEEVVDDLYDGDYESVVRHMSQWDYGEYHDFETESNLYGYTMDMGHYVLNYSTSPAPHVALYVKNETHRANRKGYKSKLDLYFSAFNRAGQMVEITAKPDGNGYIWSYQGPDYDDYDKMLITLPFEEAYNLFLKEMGLTQGDFWGPEIYTHTGNRRANRKTASEYVQPGVAYTVHSDGSVTEESVALEWLSVILREDEVEDSGGYYNWSEFEDQLNGSMHSEIVQVGNNGSFINAMHPVDVDDLVALGTGEYMLCSVSLEIEDSNGDIERDDMFEYDVIVRL